MQLFKSQSGWYSILIPDDWSTEEEEEIVSFFKTIKGVGTLQISSYMLPERSVIDIEKELINFIADYDKIIEIERLKENIKVSLDSVNVDYFDNGNRYFSFWLLHKYNKLLFVTYNSLAEDYKTEAEEILRIIDSIKIE